MYLKKVNYIFSMFNIYNKTMLCKILLKEINDSDFPEYIVFKKEKVFATSTYLTRILKVFITICTYFQGKYILLGEEYSANVKRVKRVYLYLPV